jgi:hypothetical protein
MQTLKKITKELRKKLLCELIDKYGIGVEFAKDDVDLFISLALPQEHISGVKKMRNQAYPNDPRHMWFLIDGVWVNRSWAKWIYPKSDKQKLKAAMRSEIQSDMDEFRISSNDPCAQCKSTQDLQTDHVDPPFDTIAEDFIAIKGTIEIASGPPGAGNIIADRELAWEWVAYHARHATYQILCRSCNASKGKKL